MDQTKKGPGRPAHNAHPQSCSGDPLSPDEIEKRERQRRQRKLNRQLEKQQAKLAAKGIQVDLATLRKQWESKHLPLGQSSEDSELIDVVGSDDDDDDYDISSINSSEDHLQRVKPSSDINQFNQSTTTRKSFSIDSLLFSKERDNVSSSISNNSSSSNRTNS